MSSSTTDAADAEMQDAWTYFEMEHEAVEAIRDAIASGVPDEWERIDDSHISILPGFDVEANNVEEALDAIGHFGSGWADAEIPVNGIECFHELDADEPSFVVKLDMAVTLDAVRAEQKNSVTNYGGSIHYDPVSPHVTLFKTGDGDDEHEPLSDEQQAELRAAIDAVDVPNTLTVESLKAEPY